MKRLGTIWLVAGVLSLGTFAPACGGDTESGSDAVSSTDVATDQSGGGDDAPVGTDVGEADSGGADVGTTDATTTDTGTTDTGTTDTGTTDTGTTDTGTTDTGTTDTGTTDVDTGCKGDGDCDPGSHCNTDTGVCVPDECEPGKTFCKDGNVWSCSGGGKMESQIEDCQGNGCTDGACDEPQPVCEAGTTYCKDGDVWECNAGGTEESMVADCQGYGCDAAACLKGPAFVEIASIGTDLVAQAQVIPLFATVYDENGQEIADYPVVWTSSKESLLSVDEDGVITGLAIGGGDKTTPDGSLFVTASAGGVEATLTLQVAQLKQGSGLQFKELELTDDPNSDGRAHYDGVYNTKTDPPISACNPYTGKNECSWKIADGRLFIGESMQVNALGDGKWDTFGSGLLEYPAIKDADGIAVAPPAPRPLYIEWSSSNEAVAKVAGGFVNAVAIGMTTISAKIGTQTWTLDLVVYNQYGYDPTNDFLQGVDPEDGHLMLFSSSAGMAMVGTHDVVRYVDLADYRNLDFRPSQYGPQGVRLVENLNGVNEKYPGFGCGMVKGAGDVVWLFNGWTAVPFDTAQAKQVGNYHKVMWRVDGAATGANDVCSGTFVELGGRQYLIGFDTKPYDYAVFVADVTDIDAANVEAVGVADPLFQQVPIVEFYNPALYDDGVDLWLLFMEQTPKNSPSSPNKLRFAKLSMAGNDLVVAPEEAMTIETAPTPNPPDNIGEAPALTVADVGGAPLVFVGNKDTVTVIDPATWQIVDFSGSGSDDPLIRDLDTRRFGSNIKSFAVSPDGETLYALPEQSYPVSPYFNTKVEWTNQNGSTQSTNMTVHRVALIDLADGALPRLMVDPATDPAECFLVDGCTAEQYQYGYDLNLIYLKRWMLDTGFAPSTGAIVPPQAMNIRQFAVSEKSVYIIGRDNSDGAGTALGNMSDVAIIDLASGHMPVFRGWRGNPAGLVGLSDPFGFRLGEDDAVLGDVRVKNAGVMYIPGAPPAENAGDGVPHPDDVMLPDNGAYANAPQPVTETGRVVLLSSSHAAAKDGTHDAIRELDLSQPEWPETDFDGAKDGAQGAAMTYVVKGTTIPWSGGCGMTKGPGSWAILFNGDSAIVFDTDTMTQGANGHQVTFDPDPANPTARVCTGAVVESGGKVYLYGINVDLKPLPKMFLADITDLANGNVTATDIDSPFFDEMPGADPYTVRYVAALAHEGELWFLEKNDPYNSMRNTVHRATVGAAGALELDLTRESDIVAGWTTSGDPNMLLADVGGKAHLFVGNQRSISIYDVSNAAAPVRYNYNTDGDGVQDDLDTAWYGRGIQAFALSPDGKRLYALPWEKSAALPRAYFEIPLLGGGYRTQWADRYRVAAIDLTAPGQPAIDQTLNNGNGIDVNYYWFKAWIAKTGTTALPATFPYFRRQFAASADSLFLIGFDNDDGAGSALANVGDMATYDLATGKGHLWRGYEYEGINNASGLWGYDLGVDPATGKDDVNLNGARAKNAGVMFLP